MAQSKALTEAEIAAQLADPDSAMSRVFRDRAAFIAASGPDSPLRRAAAARLANPEEREASWQTLGVRIPPETKREIEAAAQAAGRTAAAEVRWRLALTDYNLQLVAEMDKQHETLRAALAADWSGDELKKLIRIYMGAIEALTFQYRPARQVHFVAKG